MATTSEHAATVLAGVIPSRIDRLAVLQKQLGEEYFTDEAQNWIYRAIILFAETTGGVLSTAAVKDLLNSLADKGKKSLFAETYVALVRTEVDEPDFQWSVRMLRDNLAEAQTKEAITVGMEALTKGIERDGEMVSGHEIAREVVKEAFSEIDKGFSVEDAPEGDIREESDKFLREYSERKTDINKAGIRFGISNLDATLGGLQNGELILSAGYTSDGKTSLCVQLAWSAAVEQGKNVVFLTTETSRATVNRKLVARHSAMDFFSRSPFAYPVPNGLNSRDLKNGKLTAHEEQALAEVLTDFRSNTDYGKLYVAQVPRGATFSDVEAQVYRLQRKFNVDVVVMDYLALLRSDRKRNSEREEFNSLIREAKQFTTTFDSGRGVPLISPWQVNRAARVEANRVGYYTRASLSDTAESTNSADVIISILAPEENSERFMDIAGQILKNRDGETQNGILMNVDYATSKFVAKSEFSTTPFGSSDIPTEMDALYT